MTEVNELENLKKNYNIFWTKFEIIDFDSGLNRN